MIKYLHIIMFKDVIFPKLYFRFSLYTFRYDNSNSLKIWLDKC